MRKLSAANPNLTYPERKVLLEQFISTELVADNEIAAYIENSADAIETFVQGVRDEFCASSILSWA